MSDPNGTGSDEEEEKKPKRLKALVSSLTGWLDGWLGNNSRVRTRSVSSQASQDDLNEEETTNLDEENANSQGTGEVRPNASVLWPRKRPYEAVASGYRTSTPVRSLDRIAEDIRPDTGNLTTEPSTSAVRQPSNSRRLTLTSEEPSNVTRRRPSTDETRQPTVDNTSIARLTRQPIRKTLRLNSTRSPQEMERRAAVVDNVKEPKNPSGSPRDVFFFPNDNTNDFDLNESVATKRRRLDVMSRSHTVDEENYISMSSRRVVDVLSRLTSPGRMSRSLSQSRPERHSYNALRDHKYRPLYVSGNVRELQRLNLSTSKARNLLALRNTHGTNVLDDSDRMPGSEASNTVGEGSTEPRSRNETGPGEPMNSDETASNSRDEGAGNNREQQRPTYHREGTQPTNHRDGESPNINQEGADASRFNNSNRGDVHVPRTMHFSQNLSFRMPIRGLDWGDQSRNDIPFVNHYPGWNYDPGNHHRDNPSRHNNPDHHLYHNPGPANHNPGPANHNPGPANHNPGPANHNPGPANHNPGPAHHNPGPANHNPGPANHNPGHGQGNLALHQNNPQEAQENPTTQHNPSQRDSSTTSNYATNASAVSPRTRSEQCFADNIQIPEPGLASSATRSDTSDKSKKWRCQVCLVENEEKDEKCVCCAGSRPTNSENPLASTSGNPQGNGKKWRCQACWVENDEKVDKCVCCSGSRPTNADKPLSSSSTSGNPQGNGKKWRCQVCWVENDEKVDKCVCCSGSRPTNSDKPLSSSSTSGNPQGNGKKWRCQACWVENDEKVDKCVCCSGSRPTNSDKPLSSSSTSGNPQGNGKKWRCQACWVENDEKVDKCVCCSGSRPTNSDKPLSSSSTSGNPQGNGKKWRCKVCFVENDEKSEKCVCCSGSKPSNSDERESQKPPEIPTDRGVKRKTHLGEDDSDDSDKKKPDDSLFKKIMKKQATKWECTGCFTRNDCDKMKCICCEAAKPGSVKETEASKMFDFGTVPCGFKFGIPQNKETIEAPKETASDTKKDEEPKPAATTPSEVQKTEEAQVVPKFSFGIPSTAAVAPTLPTTPASEPIRSPTEIRTAAPAPAASVEASQPEPPKRSVRTEMVIENVNGGASTSSGESMNGTSSPFPVPAHTNATFMIPNTFSMQLNGSSSPPHVNTPPNQLRSISPAFNNNATQHTMFEMKPQADPPASGFNFTFGAINQMKAADDAAKAAAQANQPMQSTSFSLPSSSSPFGMLPASTFPSSQRSIFGSNIFSANNQSSVQPSPMMFGINTQSAPQPVTTCTFTFSSYVQPNNATSPFNIQGPSIFGANNPQNSNASPFGNTGPTSTAMPFGISISLPTSPTSPFGGSNSSSMTAPSFVSSTNFGNSGSGASNPAPFENLAPTGIATPYGNMISPFMANTQNAVFPFPSNRESSTAFPAQSTTNLQGSLFSNNNTPPDSKLPFRMDTPAFQCTPNQPLPNRFSFGTPTTQASPFGMPTTQATPFGTPSTQATPFGTPSTQATPFGTPSTQASPFGAPQQLPSPGGFNFSIGQQTPQASPNVYNFGAVPQFNMGSSTTPGSGSSGASVGPSGRRVRRAVRRTTPR